MNQTKPADKPSTARASSRSKKRQPRLPQVLGHLWYEWRVEILVVLMVALAIFLLVEQMQIRKTLLHWLRQGLETLGGFGGGVLRTVVDFVQNTTLSDLTGYVLLLLVLVLVAWRTRWRLMSTPRFTSRECPRCGSDLHRIHRRGRDRLLNLYVPVRRYRCRDRNCAWSGLRVGTRHPE
jgi:hypothetical protein